MMRLTRIRHQYRILSLPRQGLTQPQATEVQNSVNQGIDSAQKQVAATTAATERIARSTANAVGWGWLLAAGLTLLLAVTGARNAASGITARRTISVDSLQEDNNLAVRVDSLRAQTKKKGQ